MIQFNPSIPSSFPNSAAGNIRPAGTKPADSGSVFQDAVKAAQAELNKVDDLVRASDVSIRDLLAGRNEDITAVVSDVARADMSFKLLVGVRNKLVEAYKETMNMPL
ncbi:MAG TPA: flagellar hook-basal body complex protein FliE [Anaerohalosphaeraceae bacterium]|nr:flagellar hook-basal body complex protein FliE [Phycisphaerae bacterium]HOK94939.1 flagellar hook-basal body complex protein FliE [Anaerohalosphaeraceae bacterium]HOL30755.1 flagellar hook-basal body complex protein FliE [Anaerohalosphaeraceae bacterium]HOM75430.1 flagellar hook-basal body complex protein FliE [Anaerohalosphaeraceae bacterium]HPC63010.1 flagellar hook-basal body complex protein FliE [Anaerohalosphaeraceae bacterium]